MVEITYPVTAEIKVSYTINTDPVTEASYTIISTTLTSATMKQITDVIYTAINEKVDAVRQLTQLKTLLSLFSV